ncbi:MAG TPA: DUF3107 domain-containing protein [Acidimicrobiales bacterium]
MDVRIGVIHTVKEIDIELPGDADRDKIRKSIDTALSDETATLWLTDRHGREIAVPAARIAYVELGSPDSERRIGFGAG